MTNNGDGTGTLTSATDNGDGTGVFTVSTGGGVITVPTVPAADAAYALDGIPLDNPTYGWRVKQANTNPNPPLARTLQDFNAAGRDGTIQVRGYTSTPTVTFVIHTPHSNLELLRNLLLVARTLTLVSTPTVALNVEVVSVTPEQFMNASGGVDKVTVVFRCPDVYWRDTATTDYGPTAVTNGAGQTVTALTPSTGPVRDALISIRGGITNPQVAGANGTYMNWSGTLSTSTFLTFDTWTGRAWTGAAAFAETTEVTAAVGSGRGPYFLELVRSSNPATPGLQLVVTGTALSSPTITVRGRNAYNR